mmetsp:Transcript_94756/g.203578  ORF Transcript_94756/g.203578 Transcript_94756/m.203578 type:complete len:222 (-) Transcript_94756:2-667(-)
MSPWFSTLLLATTRSSSSRRRSMRSQERRSAEFWSSIFSIASLAIRPVCLSPPEAASTSAAFGCGPAFATRTSTDGRGVCRRPVRKAASSSSFLTVTRRGPSKPTTWKPPPGTFTPSGSRPRCTQRSRKSKCSHKWLTTSSSEVGLPLKVLTRKAPAERPSERSSRKLVGADEDGRDEDSGRATAMAGATAVPAAHTAWGLHRPAPAPALSGGMGVSRAPA